MRYLDGHEENFEIRIPEVEMWDCIDYWFKYILAALDLFRTINYEELDWRRRKLYDEILHEIKYTENDNHSRLWQEVTLTLE